MPGIFSRLAGKKKKGNLEDIVVPSTKPWEDAWSRSSVDANEIHELVRRCTEELKSRALDLPFFLLPFRPTSNPSAVRTFVRRFFDPAMGLKGDNLSQELRMTDPMVICGIIKWCWSRLEGGVVGWDVYDLFKSGENEAGFARDSFKTFIPLSVTSEAKSDIIFDFFDLLSAIAAHAKLNGMGGRKLSRMAAWWTFEHKDTGNGFDGGYKRFLSAADATSHMFFAYLRSLSPENPRAGMSILPVSMQKLLDETEYPPERPTLLQYQTHKIAMHVNAVSPTPFSLLRRASHFQFRDSDRGLRAYSEYEDPVEALTEECRRVLKAISSVGHSRVASSKNSTSLRDASWSRFEDLGFSSTLDEIDSDDDKAISRRPVAPMGLRTTPASGSAINLGRPTTPSWADFMSSGFDDSTSGPNSPNLLLPPDKILPPIETTVRQNSSQSHRPRLESDSLEPGELASISSIELDDCFWWVWISSLGPEETANRKSSFGRCAVIETDIKAARWLVIEELVVGAGPDPAEGAYIAEKKGFFSWTRRGKISRSKSTATKPAQEKGLDDTQQLGSSKTSIGPDQQARIQAAAAQLQAKQHEERLLKTQPLAVRRGRTDSELMREKTNSMLTLQTVIVTEASPAMKWTKKYDKDAIREKYLTDTNTGKGLSLQNGPTQSILEEEPQRPQTPDAAPVIDADAPKPSIEVKVTSPKTSVSPDAKKSKKLQKTVITSEKPVVIPNSPVAEKQSSGGGFKKLFGRKNRSSKVPDNAAADLNAMLKQAEKPLPSPKAANVPTPAAVPAEDAPVPAPKDLPEPEPVQDDSQESANNQESPESTVPVSPLSPVSTNADAAPAPVVSSVPKQTPGEYEPSLDDISTDDATEARQEFSRFDQGPLTDQPAFVPANSDSDDATPPPIARRTRGPDTVVAAAAALKPVKRAPEPEKPRSEFEDERWARLRRNAQQRAMQRQGQIPVSVKPSPAAPMQAADADEETSGEESIEARVARIKARVAELTNNMEGPPGSGIMAPSARQ
ncbi:hypothetical protein TD95_000079 [Thielaviopsis punctulata]|uniref:Meiotically up-regulated protein Msb1/Mug8 domain-containing protein n=1 Tax=Thielaviopsis punctulata TaxID=72032 RepID=A0A0F4Z6S4_9PEZI|nr:hypothetical protein TD95_000079 [Thielaviopsis punctulata]